MTFFMMYGPHVTRYVAQNTRPSSTFREGLGMRLVGHVWEPNAMLLILLMISSRYWILWYLLCYVYAKQNGD